MRWGDSGRCDGPFGTFFSLIYKRKGSWFGDDAYFGRVWPI